MSDELPFDDRLKPADRSILETAAECPRQAAFAQSGLILNANYAMESGNGCHTAISETITEWVESRGALSVADIADYLIQRLCSARPDVQPDVVAGARAMAWSLGKYLNVMHYQDILAWDGGTGEHSSQYAHDLPEFSLRITSELDLLHASESPEIVTEVDFKTGWTRWDHVKLADSFQFQLHAVLLLHRFPDAKAAQVKIWNTRTNHITYPVLFKRENLYQYEYRIRNAAAAYSRILGKEPNQVEAWPLVEKCESCPAARLCDASNMPQDTPEDVVDLIAVLEAKTAALKKIAAKAVKERGSDINTQAGNWFGINRPKASRAPTMSLYQLKSKKEESDDDSESAAT